MSRLKEKFDTLKNINKKALVSFISAYDPNFSISKRLLFELPKAGADIIEVGLPFSDPMADGPTIQKSSLRGIKSGFSVKKTSKNSLYMKFFVLKYPMIANKNLFVFN